MGKRGRPTKRCRLHGLKKGDMRRLTEAGNTTHELMAISGHCSPSEVQRYTADADRKRLADSGMAKKLAGQKENANVANLPAPAHKPHAKPRKRQDKENEMAVPTELNE